MGNHEERHDLPRSCRDALSKKCYGIHKTGQNKNGIHKVRTEDLWDTRFETQIQKKWSTPLKEWTTPDSRNAPSTTNLEEEDERGRPRKRWKCVDIGTVQTT